MTSFPSDNKNILLLKSFQNHIDECLGQMTYDKFVLLHDIPEPPTLLANGLIALHMLFNRGLELNDDITYQKLHRGDKIQEVYGNLLDYLNWTLNQQFDRCQVLWAKNQIILNLTHMQDSAPNQYQEIRLLLRLVESILAFIESHHNYLQECMIQKQRFIHQELLGSKGSINSVKLNSTKFKIPESQRLKTQPGSSPKHQSTPSTLTTCTSRSAPSSEVYKALLKQKQQNRLQKIKYSSPPRRPQKKDFHVPFHIQQDVHNVQAQLRRGEKFIAQNLKLSKSPPKKTFTSPPKPIIPSNTLKTQKQKQTLKTGGVSFLKEKPSVQSIKSSQSSSFQQKKKKALTPQRQAEINDQSSDQSRFSNQHIPMKTPPRSAYENKTQNLTQRLKNVNVVDTGPRRRSHSTGQAPIIVQDFDQLQTVRKSILMGKTNSKPDIEEEANQLLQYCSDKPLIDKHMLSTYHTQDVPSSHQSVQQQNSPQNLDLDRVESGSSILEEVRPAFQNQQINEGFDKHEETFEDYVQIQEQGQAGSKDEDIEIYQVPQELVQVEQNQEIDEDEEARLREIDEQIRQIELQISMCQNATQETESEAQEISQVEVAQEVAPKPNQYLMYAINEMDEDQSDDEYHNELYLQWCQACTDSTKAQNQQAQEIPQVQDEVVQVQDEVVQVQDEAQIQTQNEQTEIAQPDQQPQQLYDYQQTTEYQQRNEDPVYQTYQEQQQVEQQPQTEEEQWKAYLDYYKAQQPKPPSKLSQKIRKVHNLLLAINLFGGGGEKRVDRFVESDQNEHFEMMLCRPIVRTFRKRSTPSYDL